ncbi:reverse transcriptase/maturase family protein [Blautia massiliensis (ex Durand et al. 2017)]|uniref:reverse transcriptase/maturase family protein n=1 Tax=Blautia massiliensis (ex Durand et al. 2017) TaxID=1737424 RepID=UPI0024300AF5|nr:reverse transcriptase/maturase family protein [Blautia massiliensis (ex Durand et al. 2017)]
MNKDIKSNRKEALMSLYEKIYDTNNMEESYKRTQSAERKYRKEAIYFSMSKERKLRGLRKELKDKTYRSGSYIEFYVYEPKKRLVHAPHIRDKIVQFSIHTVLQGVYRPVFIKDSYACLEDKGTHEAVHRIQHYMRLAQWKYEEPYIVKIDVRKFFYSINRDILKTIYRKKIPESEQDFLRILDMIVDSSPEGEKGLPLGNVTSQDFANIYLNEVDQFCKRYLGLKWYVRYMDDICIIVKDRETARNVLAKIRAYVKDHLDLELNEKTHIYALAQGINTLGFRIHTTHLEVRNSSKAAMKRRIKKIDEKVQSGRLTKKQAQQAVNAWLGHARHSNSYNLAKKIFEKYDYIQIEDKDWKFGDISPKKRKELGSYGKRNHT